MHFRSLVLLSFVCSTANAAIDFVAPRTSNTQSPTVLAAGDFNGDGFPDLVAAPESKPVLLFLGRGDATFSDGTFVSGTFGAPGVAAADVDADGKLDVIALQNGVIVFRGN